MNTTRALTLALALASTACTAAPADPWICNTPPDSCISYVAGWTEADARASCNPLSSTFARGTCPAEHIGTCTWTADEGARVGLILYYAPTYSTTTALENCDTAGGSFSTP